MEIEIDFYPNRKGKIWERERPICDEEKSRRIGS